MHILDTASKVVDALGGTAEVAKLTKSKLQTVSNWRSTGRIPARTYLILRRELRIRGFVAPPSVWGIEETNGDEEKS